METKYEVSAVRDRRKPCAKFGRQPKMYCDCGCMTPDSLDYDMAGVVVTGRAETGYADYTISRHGVPVGEVNTQYATIYMDGVEYLGVSAGSPLYRLVADARALNIPQAAVSCAGVMTHDEVRDTSVAEMDDRNARHPGYCGKCHTYCYGDCEA